jgi:hypothetical protein
MIFIGRIPYSEIKYNESKVVKISIQRSKNVQDLFEITIVKTKVSTANIEEDFVNFGISSEVNKPQRNSNVKVEIKKEKKSNFDKFEIMAYGDDDGGDDNDGQLD